MLPYDRRNEPLRSQPRTESRNMIEICGYRRVFLHVTFRTVNLQSVYHEKRHFHYHQLLIFNTFIYQCLLLNQCCTIRNFIYIFSVISQVCIVAKRDYLNTYENSGSDFVVSCLVTACILTCVRG